MKRVYVTGAQGMLGKILVPLLSGRCEVRGTDLPLVDIRDEKAIFKDILDFSPQMVFHLASITDVDGCETSPEEAYRSNVLGTRHVARACRECDAVMAYMSTGMIYNGKKKYPYIEYDKPDPISIYGKTKYEGELEIESILRKYFIFNTCWMYGGGSADRKFVAKIIELARSRKELRVVDDKFGSPTYSADLAAKMLDMIEITEYGRYHCVNDGCVSRYELASEILKLSNIRECRLIPVSSSEFPLPAPRPRMEAMTNYSLKLMGLDTMRDWRAALADYISNCF